MLLSLDVGFANMGWVVFEKGEIFACNTLQTEKSQRRGTRVANDHAYRSIVLATGLNKIIDDYNIQGIIGELPSGGAQNARAMGFMMSAISIAASVGALWNIPMEWTDPNSVKKALAGVKNASKETMMEKAVKEFHFRYDGKAFWFGDEKFPKGMFEHIADACGVYLALKNDNLVKMFG